MPQAVRNLDDLECMACPRKYRELQTFYKYYSGEKKAPVPTLFSERLPRRAQAPLWPAQRCLCLEHQLSPHPTRLAHAGPPHPPDPHHSAGPSPVPPLPPPPAVGGNHEAANYLWELYYGGWSAPGIFFLGYAGVVNFGGVRIGGLSGIFKPQHYRQGHHERPPYNDSSLRSSYHVRQLDVWRLLHLRRPLDVFLSHDWPQGIARHGNMQALFRRKAFLKSEVRRRAAASRARCPARGEATATGGPPTAAQ